MNSYIFRQYIFHNCLSNVWRAFESHQESQVLVFTKWCDDGTGVLTFVFKLKRIVLHTIVKFSKILVPRTFAQNIVIIGMLDIPWKSTTKRRFRFQSHLSFRCNSDCMYHTSPGSLLLRGIWIPK